MGRFSGTLVGFLWLFTAIVTYSLDAQAFKIVSFDGKFTRWSTNEVSYVVDERGSKNFNAGCDEAGDCVSEREAIARSFATWTAVPGVKLQFKDAGTKQISSTGYDKENSIIWIKSGWLQQPFTPPSAALAVTISTYKTSNKEIVDSDIHFNDEFFDWAVIDTPDEESANVVDIENIATHEIGHFIGLDHSSEDIFEPDQKLYLATMFFASGPGEIFRRNLHEDDMAAANNLYPDADGVAPEVDSISPDRVDAYSSASAVVTIKGRNFGANTVVLIATSSDAGDVSGHVLSSSETEMQVAFDLYALPSGSYDVVVLNTYSANDRVENGFTVEGGIGASNGGDAASTGYASSGGGGCEISLASDLGSFSATGLTAVLLPLLLIAWARLQLLGRLRRKEVPLNSSRRSIRP